jgi:caffeoyl-CoA O-methyltransferase
VDETHAAVARRYHEEAGVADRITIHLGPALETIEKLEGEFDLIFIDADKLNYPAYYEALVPRLSPRGIMALDNTLWSGRVVEPPETPETEMFVELNARIAADPRVVAVLLTVRDGVTLVRRAG